MGGTDLGMAQITQLTSLPSSGCFVDINAISCLNCGRTWPVGLSTSVYEQQSQESCPCPYCGSYTLCYTESSRKTRAPGEQHTAA